MFCNVVKSQSKCIFQVDEDECLSHEVLHLLCVESQGHAALNRALPEDAHHETGLERVADKVAVFRKPLQGTGRGVFSLKPEFYGDYNVYHYHYSREDQSRSEDNVRKIRRGRNEENCCPPPVPIPLAPALRGLVGLMNCDITMHLIHQVLLRTYDLRSRTFSEGQLQAALHLTGLALREEEARQQDKSRTAFEFSVKAQESYRLLSVLESLQTNGRVDVHRPLLMWTIRKFRSVHSAAQVHSHYPLVTLVTITNFFNPPPQSNSSTEGPGASMEAESAEGPGQESPAEAAARQRKAEMVVARRAAILAQMSAQQQELHQGARKTVPRNRFIHIRFFPPPGLDRVVSFLIFAFQRVVALRQHRISALLWADLQWTCRKRRLLALKFSPFASAQASLWLLQHPIRVIRVSFARRNTVRRANNLQWSWLHSCSCRQSSDGKTINPQQKNRNRNLGRC